MRLKDVFSRRRSAPDTDTEPGSVSSPLDVGGRGPVGLADRTAPGGQGSPDTNQAKAEPMPATPGEADPAAAVDPPELATMNVGADDPQRPSHPVGRPRDDVPADEDVSYAGGTLATRPVNPGMAPGQDRPAIDPAGSDGRGAGPERPAQASDGTAQRQPGSLGVSPEEQDSDVDAGRAHMEPARGAGVSGRPGDALGIGEPSDQAAEGTSEEQRIADGIRTPRQD